MKRVFSILMLFLTAIYMAEAKVEPAPVFSDHMVLQQQTDAAVWGKAKPNAKVTITTTWSKTKTVVYADASAS
jgi:sialate O-acetylesterase